MWVDGRDGRRYSAITQTYKHLKQVGKPGFQTEFFGGGGKNDAHRAMPPRGVWGVCSPRKFLKFTCSEVAAEAPKRVEISY